jgi:hypothetical protein
MLSGRRLFAVDHPWGTKLVDQHTKPVRPEGLSERHPNNAAFAERAKNALGPGRVVYLNAHAEALRFGCKLWWRVATHQQTIANLQAGMHDTSGSFRILRNARIGGRICVSRHHQDFSAEDFFVVLERHFALTIQS